MLVSKTIFRDYDIRGVYPRDIDATAALLIGKALGTLLSKKNYIKAVVGRDDRESSPILTKNFIDGLLSTGINVTYIDVTLTPVIHFLTCTEDFDAGVIVTASHNPAQFNGFRIDLKNAVPYCGADILSLYDLIQKNKYKEGKGSYEEKNLSEKYIKFIKEKFSLQKKFKIVVDCGSGASSVIAPKLFNEIGVGVVPVYCEYNSNFPHGVPDPESPLFLEELQRRVVENKADVGFGYDTDGDRFGVVDEKGNSYDTDQMLLLFASDVLIKNKGKKVICDVKCSQLVEELVPPMGGSVEMIRTGHTYFVKEVALGKAILGAEYSGHVYFGDDYFGYDDGIYASCRLLDIMDRSGLKLSELMQHFPSRENTPEIKLECADTAKFDVIEKLKKDVKEAGQYKNIRIIDGVRANCTDTGWFLIRASNTSPYLSVRMEAKDKNELAYVGKNVFELVSKYGDVDIKNLKRFFGLAKDKTS